MRSPTYVRAPSHAPNISDFEWWLVLRFCHLNINGRAISLFRVVFASHFQLLLVIYVLVREWMCLRVVLSPRWLEYMNSSGYMWLLNCDWNAVRLLEFIIHPHKYIYIYSHLSPFSLKTLHTLILVCILLRFIDSIIFNVE